MTPKGSHVLAPTNKGASILKGSHILIYGSQFGLACSYAWEIEAITAKQMIPWGLACPPV